MGSGGGVGGRGTGLYRIESVKKVKKEKKKKGKKRKKKNKRFSCVRLLYCGFDRIINKIQVVAFVWCCRLLNLFFGFIYNGWTT